MAAHLITCIRRIDQPLPTVVTALHASSHNKEKGGSAVRARQDTTKKALVQTKSSDSEGSADPVVTEETVSDKGGGWFFGWGQSNDAAEGAKNKSDSKKVVHFEESESDQEVMSTFDDAGTSEETPDEEVGSVDSVSKKVISKKGCAVCLCYRPRLSRGYIVAALIVAAAIAVGVTYLIFFLPRFQRRDNNPNIFVLGASTDASAAAANVGVNNGKPTHQNLPLSSANARSKAWTVHHNIFKNVWEAG